MCVRSKQPRRIKSIVYNDVSTFLRRKKVQSPAKQFKELFSLCQITFDEMESSFPRFNHVCFFISALDRSSKMLSWVKAVLFRVFSLFELFFTRSGERKPTWNAGHCFARKFSNFVATSKARIWLAICEFLWLLTNQNVWFVILLYTELTPFCTELPENCIYLNQSEMSNFFMYIINDVIGCMRKRNVFFPRKFSLRNFLIDILKFYSL